MTDVSIQLSAVSRQPTWHRLWPWPKGHATRMATLCERRIGPNSD
ncbi:hypothetical protein [Moorena producens]|nr:hypothetical protein [Moorena producens]